MSYLFCEEHGGGCCGISHIFQFPPDKETWVSPGHPRYEWSDTGRPVLVRGKPDESKGKWDAERVTDRITVLMGQACEVIVENRDIEFVERLFEIVLNEVQIDEWRDVIEKIGFKQVSTFTNSNSGNRCFVFHCIYNYGSE